MHLRLIVFSEIFSNFLGRPPTVCKTVRPMLSDRCLSVSELSVLFVCLSVSDVGVLCPNGWIDQDETWHAGRPRPSPHCIRWGPSSPSPKKGGAPHLSAHICYGQMAARTKMPLGMEVGLGPGDFVLNWDQAPPPQKGRRPSPNFRPMSIVAKWLDGSSWQLAWGWASVLTLC